MPNPIFSLVVRNVSKSFGPKDILHNVTFTLASGDCFGVVAPNGTGKSTLLRLVAGVDEVDSGAITLNPPSLTIGYLPQEHERRETETLRDFLARRCGITAAENELELAAAALGEGADGADDRYADALDRYLRLGGPDFDARSSTVCNDVGLPESALGVAMTGLSGGQVARGGLAAILLSRFDVLLLDEPTNDLDFNGLQQLEQFVNESRETAILLVSHDREFLAKTVTSVLELDENSHGASVFNGGWEAFLEEREVQRGHAQERYSKFVGQRDDLKARAQQQREWATSGVKGEKRRPTDGDKMQRGFRVDRTEKLASKARASEKALDRLESVDKPWEGWELQLKLEVKERSSEVVAYLRGARIERGNFSLGPIDVQLNWQDRLAIVGPNGSGKTTLLRALLGELPLADGSQHLSSTVNLGHMDQQRALFDTDKSLVDVFVEAAGVLPQEARSLLAKFRLGADHIVRPASTLSPGERTRATLAMISAKGANLLILDEPTNHLDLEAIEQLEAALQTYDGTLILITHDRRLLDTVKITQTITL